MDMTNNSNSVSKERCDVKIKAVVKILNDVNKMQDEMDVLQEKRTVISDKRYEKMDGADKLFEGLYDDNFEFIMQIDSVPTAIKLIQKDLRPLINEWLLYLSSMITTSRTLQVDKGLYISRAYGMKRYREYSSLHLFNYILHDMRWNLKETKAEDFLYIRNGVLYMDNTANATTRTFDLKTITKNVSVDSSKTNYFMELTKKICEFLREGFLADAEALGIAKDIKDFKSMLTGSLSSSKWDVGTKLKETLVTYNNISEKINDLKDEIDLVYQKTIKKNHQYRVLLKLKNKKLNFDYGIPKLHTDNDVLN